MHNRFSFRFSSKGILNIPEVSNTFIVVTGSYGVYTLIYLTANIINIKNTDKIKVYYTRPKRSNSEEIELNISNIKDTTNVLNNFLNNITTDIMLYVKDIIVYREGQLSLINGGTKVSDSIKKLFVESSNTEKGRIDRQAEILPTSEERKTYNEIVNSIDEKLKLLLDLSKSINITELQLLHLQDLSRLMIRTIKQFKESDSR